MQTQIYTHILEGLIRGTLIFHSCQDHCRSHCIFVKLLIKIMFDMVIIVFAIGVDERKYYILLSLFCLTLYDLNCGDRHARGKK